MDITIEKPWQTAMIVGAIVIQALGAVVWMTMTYSEILHHRNFNENKISEIVDEIKELNVQMKQVNDHNTAVLGLIRDNREDISVIKAVIDKE